MKRLLVGSVLVGCLAASPAAAQVWDPNLGNGMYRNPIIFADYSDPDVIRVGDDFWMTSSSFNHVPALPILHSKDLVNWTLVNHAVERFDGDPFYDTVQHGNGVWAPSMRYHDGHFWIYWGDPDRGIYMVKTRDPLGEWDPPLLVHAARGWIDPSPLWDDDGNAYLVYAFARSRAGFNSVLHVARMSPDGTRLLDEGRLVFDGTQDHPTIEGPKFYKRNGYYYIFAPGGGVRPGWQVVLRSRNVFGPYEDRIVLAQGSTPINGPHQGGWVELESGEHWFVHFQDRLAYGRITHLNPVRWVDDWPLMGINQNEHGTGEPVLEYRMPDVGRTYPRAVPQTTDEFDGARLGLQWQWQANYRDDWFSLDHRRRSLRLASQRMPAGAVNLWPVPNLLLQKLPAPEFQATTRVTFTGREAGERAGLVIFGMNHASLVLERTRNGVQLVHARALKAHEGQPEQVVQSVPVRGNSLYLRATVRQGAVAHFAYSTDGRTFTPIGDAFQADEGRWVGAKVGLYAVAPQTARRTGHADFEFFRIEPAAAQGAEAIPTTLKWSERMALSELKRNPDPMLLDFQQQPKWEYTHGLVLRAVDQVRRATDDPRYAVYVRTFYDYMVEENGDIRTYDLAGFNIDRLNPGRLLFTLHEQTGEEKYLRALRQLRHQVEWQPRTREGGFWHKLVYPHQMWLDGAYMGSPFYAEYASRFGEPESFEDVARQIILMDRYMRDPRTGLLYHGWDESRTQRWANPETGTSPHFWGRAIGWYVMAIVDVLEYMPQEHARRAELIDILERTVIALMKYQDPQTGLWHQVVDQVGREGNYLEASASTMYVYGIAKAVNRGWLDRRYRAVAEKAYEGILANLVTVDADGEVHIHRVCAVAGLGGRPYRDGSYEYYISEPVRSNDPKATGPFILASLELGR